MRMVFLLRAAASSLRFLLSRRRSRSSRHLRRSLFRCRCRHSSVPAELLFNFCYCQSFSRDKTIRSSTQAGTPTHAAFSSPFGASDATLSVMESITQLQNDVRRKPWVPQTSLHQRVSFPTQTSRSRHQVTRHSQVAWGQGRQRRRRRGKRRGQKLST